MAEYTFTGNDGVTLGRDQLLLYLNTSTKEAPVWRLIGYGVEESSMELDWQRESIKDITGNTRNRMRKPIITQSFTPWDLAVGDAAQHKLWTLAFVEQNAQALCNMDLLLEHRYASFAERYEESSVEVTGLGGPGGGNVSMPINVTFGGKRTTGTVTESNGNITFNETAS